MIAYGNLILMFGFVWLKRRLKRRERALSPFWDAVADDYLWRKGRQQNSAEHTATELEAASAPAGRGDELVGLVQAEDADMPAEGARSPSKTGLSERAGPPRA